MLILSASAAYAAPERLEIKSDAEKGRRAKAEVKAKAIDLSRVQDPEVRVALQAIFDSLNLKAKKAAQ